jgi:hypothetical protein
MWHSKMLLWVILNAQVLERHSGVHNIVYFLFQSGTSKSRWELIRKKLENFYSTPDGSFIPTKFKGLFAVRIFAFCEDVDDCAIAAF